MNRFKVLTVVTPDIMDYARYHIASMGEYAGRNGYIYEVKTIAPSFLKHRAPHWSKISAATWEQQHPTPGVEWVFVVDADTLVVDMETRLETFTDQMKEGECIGLCDDAPNGGLVNTGSMLIRSEGVAEYLKEWWDTGAELGLEFAKYHEQDTLVYLMKQKVWEDRVKVFPATAFNSVSDDLDSSLFLRHYMARTKEERKTMMRHDYMNMYG